MPATVLNGFTNIFAALRKRYCLLIIISLLPFVMFHWMLPFITEIAPGHIFVKHYNWLQTEYMFALRTGTFPLNLIFGYDQSNVGAPHSLIYLPIPYIAALIPGYWTGQAIHINILLHLLTIPVAHYVLYMFLRKINLTKAIAFFLSTATVYCPRILFPFFYGFALQAWTGHLILCAAISFYCLKRSKTKGPLSIIGATYWLINSGHPEEMYFGLLAVLFFLLIIPYFLATLLPDRDTSLKTVTSFWSRVAFLIATGILLSAAGILPFYVDVVRNVRLGNTNYADACFLTDTFMGLVSNFFSPLRACFADGAFAGTPLVLVALLIPVLVVFRFKIPGVIWAILGMIALVMLCMQGEKTPVHFCAWKYLPFFASTRIPGRISMALPILFMLLLAWLFKQGPRPLQRASSTKIPPLSALAIIALTANLGYLLGVPDHVKNDLYLISRGNLSNITNWAEPCSIMIGFIILVTAAVYGFSPKTKTITATGVILCIATCCQLILLLQSSPTPRKEINQNDHRTFERFLEQKKQQMNLFYGYLYPYDDALLSNDIARQLDEYFVEPHLAKIYKKYICADNHDEAYKILNQDRKPDEIVVENCDINLPSVESSSVGAANHDKVTLIYSSFNRMVFNAYANQPSLFFFSYTFTGHWTAWINGEKTPSYRANGYAHVVPIPTGTSIVEFRYRSRAAFWGMLLSCATLAMLGIITGVFLLRTPSGYALTTVMALAGIGIFFLWYHSLYTGDDLQTQYQWESSASDTTPNIAYGKPTKMLTHEKGYRLMHNSRHAVDGGKSFQSCFVTHWHPYDNPWWEVDLTRPEQISTIKIFYTLQGEHYDKFMLDFSDSYDIKFYPSGIPVAKTEAVAFNLSPLTIGISSDYKNWDYAVTEITDNHETLTIQPEKPITGRYIRIAATGECRLCLDEVEVY